MERGRRKDGTRLLAVEVVCLEVVQILVDDNAMTKLLSRET